MNFCSYTPRCLATMIGMLTVACPLARADAPDLPAAKVDPPRVTVLILPTADVSPNAGTVRPMHEGVVTHRIISEFISRHFKVIGPDMALDVAKKNPDLKVAEENIRTSDTMEKLAKQFKAGWVVAFTIVEAKTDSFTPGNWNVHGTVRQQIYDAKRHGWLANDDCIGHKGSNGQAAGPMMMFNGVLDTAAQSSLSTTLASYPQVVTLVDEFGNAHFLFGQTKPFLADPKTPFAGLPQPAVPPVRQAVDVTVPTPAK